jgi:diguanylate cyclase (GGDEF)-like protein
VVVGAIELAYFRDMFANIKLGNRDYIVVMRNDGVLIVREPFNDGKANTNGEGFRRVLMSRAGLIEGPATFDGVNRLYAYSHVGDLPLVVGVGLSLEDIYAPLQTRALRVGVVIAILCCAVITLMTLFQRELGRRQAVETGLAAAVRELTAIARTDALTSLANRLHFDERLDQEWRRAAREKRSISLLMIDADQFKAFNDLYGHQAGDLALKEIADAISSNIGRPGDFAARYGGEEFAVLLPGTDLRGAHCVAEKIRLSVAELKRPHAGNSAGIATVSIGIACVYPLPGTMVSGALLGSADAALYEAKRRGRNRIETSYKEASKLAS